MCSVTCGGWFDKHLHKANETLGNRSMKQQDLRIYHEYQSNTEVLLNEEPSRILQLPLSL